LAHDHDVADLRLLQARLPPSTSLPIADVARKHRVSEQTLYVWRKRFGTMSPLDTKRLKQLESENGRLKKLLAERDLEVEVLKEISAKKW